MPSFGEFAQFTVAGLIAGSAYALVGVAFGIILSVTGRFHFAFMFTYAISAYAASQVGESYGFPFWLALIFGALVGTVFGVAAEALVYRPLAERSGVYALLVIFVASLGLTIVGRNLMSLIWIDSASKQIQGFSNVGYHVAGLDLTKLGLIQVVVAWTLVILLGVLLSYTALGRVVRAVRINPEMSLVVGINPKIVYLQVFAIGSFLGGVAAVLNATQTAAKPDMGFNPLFYAFVVAFLAGLGSHPVRVGLVGLAIGLVESWSSLFMSTRWTSLVVFGILFVYVALRPVNWPDIRRRFRPVAA
ncbi:branched-chain amino acid ABC transporter permease [Ilumatobacter sp.]|uniref:branched-chain amino acid ABC transporter permease n=1 Tax=Ilumatobacter sp. TaxID=1967498 RepID=UPI0037519516